MLTAVASRRVLTSVVAVLGLGFAVSGAAPDRDRTILGRSERLGSGTVQSFVTLDRAGAPLAIGVTLSAGALEQLPAVPNAVSRCYDLDGDGKYTGHECHGDEERILDVPADSSAKLPFRWIQINWNPAGHYNTPYARPHFDFHFHTGDRARVEAIAPGRCGELVDCRQFKIATRPVPARYVPSGYIDIGAVVPRMGNHLLDSRSPELQDSLPFTSTFIYGAWDGELIFWEPMITLEFLASARDTCLEIRQPDAYRQAGYYPSEYCVRQKDNGERTVSLEQFRYSPAR